MVPEHSRVYVSPLPADATPALSFPRLTDD